LNQPNKIIIILLGLFLIGIAPFALSYFMVAPSEQFYSDASLTMMDNGDYFTPYFDGDYRFKKPILTYWMVLPAFQWLGVSFWSSRLLFWLAGALTLWYTWKMARMVFGDDLKSSVLAVLFTATHPMLVISASRSIPDMPLALFTTLGIWGVLGILKYSGEQKKYYYYLYAGFGLAFAVKGAPGLVLGGLALLYLWFNKGQRTPLLRTFYLPALLTGLILALWWYVLMYHWYGDTFIEGFLFDQVDDRVIKESYRLLTNMIAFVLLIFYPVPWNLMIAFRIRNFKKWLKEADPTLRSAVWISLIWIAFFMITAPVLTKFYDRYTLPLVPLLALPAAHFIAHYEVKWDRMALWLVNGLFLLSLAGLLIMLAGLPWEFLIWLGLAGNLGGFVVYKKNGWLPDALKPSWKYALPIFGFYFNVALIIAPVNSPNIGDQIVESYLMEGYQFEHIMMADNTKPVSKVRIAAYGTFTVERETDWEIIMTKDPDLIVLRERDLEKLGEDYETALAAVQYPDLLKSNLFRTMVKRPKKYYFAVRKAVP
jgi:4-amino-4-deoxy-L-arabinose transferase-like glycosyltransferase